MTYSTRIILRVTDNDSFSIDKIDSPQELLKSHLVDRNKTADFKLIGKASKSFSLKLKTSIYSFITLYTGITGGATDDEEATESELPPASGRRYAISVETESRKFFEDFQAGKYQRNESGYWYHLDTGECLGHNEELKEFHSAILQLQTICQTININE